MAGKTSRDPSRAWMFTWFPGDAEAQPVFKDDVMTYMAYQQEICPTTQRRHFQGCLWFKERVRLRKAKELLALEGVHLEPVRGTVDEAVEYCSKVDTAIPGTFREFGHRPRHGARNDLKPLAQAASLIQGGSSLREVAEEFPDLFIRHARGMQDLRNVLQTEVRTWKTEVVWLHGYSGAGKSRTAYEEAGPDAYTKPPGKWWDLYDRHEKVIIDDFKGDIPFDQLLKIMDRYPLTLEKKGGTVTFLAKKMWITSINPPECYVPAGEPPEQLLRRIDVQRELR